MSDVSNEKLDELEKLAKAATPGPWRAKDPYGAVLPLGLVAICDHGGRNIANTDSLDNDFECEANAAHIAAADPPTVLALIAELRRRRGEG